MFKLEDWRPMDPNMGPPLPKFLGVAWPRVEPSWAKTLRGLLQVTRVDHDQILEFEFVGLGAWLPDLPIKSADYIGWRETGFDKGDADAWLTIYKNTESEQVGFQLYGIALEVLFNGALVPAITGAYFFNPGYVIG